MVKFFFRHPRKGVYSIEELFNNIQKALPEDVVFKNHVLSLHSIGLVNRLKIAREVKQSQECVNHVTGDVSYTVLSLEAKQTILTIHDIESVIKGNLINKLILKLFWFTLPCKHVRYVTVISETTKKKLLEVVNIPESKIKVIPNCISPLISHTPKNFNTENPVILAIGTKANKNLENLIRAIQGIHCELIVLGKLSDSQAFLLEECEVDYQSFSNLKYEEVIALYKQADMLSFASFYEGFGMPIIEAQATGRPVITSNCSSMPEVAGKGALFVDPKKPKDIKKAVLRIINDTELRNSLIEEGLENVKRFKAEAVAEQYAELYREILADIDR